MPQTLHLAAPGPLLRLQTLHCQGPRPCAGRRPTAGSSPADRRSLCAPFPRLGAWDVAGRAGAASPGASASVVMTSGSLWGDQPDTDAARTRNS